MVGGHRSLVLPRALFFDDTEARHGTRVQVRLEASSCHISTSAAKLSFQSHIFCWILEDLLLTEHALNSPICTLSRGPWRWMRWMAEVGPPRRPWNSWPMLTSSMHALFPFTAGISPGWVTWLIVDVTVWAAIVWHRHCWPARRQCGVVITVKPHRIMIVANGRTCLECWTPAARRVSTDGTPHSTPYWSGRNDDRVLCRQWSIVCSLVELRILRPHST